MEMVSPMFRAFSGSRWREDVEATWSYLSQHYDIIGTKLAATHIHIGLEPAYSLTDLKRLAQAVIHFETAFELLVPCARRENIYAKSNWLDAHGLARKGKSRRESIVAIEEVANIHDLLDLLHPVVPSKGCNDRNFAWNFHSWSTKQSVEFRKPPASLTSKEALSWAELAMSFAQASTSCPTSQELQRIPPTIGGLRWFLRKYANVPGVNQPGRLQRLWRGKDPEAILEPVPQAPELECQERREMETLLKNMIVADKRRIRLLIRQARGRYW